MRRRLRDLREAELTALGDYVAAFEFGATKEELRAIGERRRAAANEREDLMLALTEIEVRNLPRG